MPKGIGTLFLSVLTGSPAGRPAPSARPGQKLLDGRHGLRLLFLRGDGGGQVPFLGAVVAELSVVAALDLHDVLGVVDVVLHALVQRAVDGEGVLQRIFADVLHHKYANRRKL